MQRAARGIGCAALILGTFLPLQAAAQAAKPLGTSDHEVSGVEVTLLEQFHCYSDPKRDARGHTCSVVFLGRADGEPRAADDAKAVRVFPLTALPSLAFDHGQILEDYRRYRATGARPPATR